jgi:hypothetical protein
MFVPRSTFVFSGGRSLETFGVKAHMGLFSKKITEKPTVESQGLHIEYDPDTEIWQFSDKGTAFVAFGRACAVPSLSQIADIHADVDRLTLEMARKLEKGVKECQGVKMNDGETFLVNITDLRSKGSFEVSWSGGQSWGDMGIDFTIKDHKIIDESWGD